MAKSLAIHYISRNFFSIPLFLFVAGVECSLTDMESKKKKNSNRNIDKYLPQELWIQQIIPRLPVKTLMRFRCVCKNWCSIIDDPRFIYVHLKLYKNNCDKNQILAMEGLGYGGHRGYKFTIRRSLSLRKTAEVLNASGSCSLLGSCNGLTLLRFRSQIKLWNPSIRRCVNLVLPNPPASTKYVLGYAPLTNDYKVVGFKISCSSTMERELSCAIYSLNGDVWRTKRHGGMGIPRYGFVEGKGFVFFQGASYWLEYDPYNSDRFGYSVESHLAFFDFDTEELSYVELPDAGCSEEFYPTDMSRCLFLIGESLAVFCITPVRRCVWMMEKDGGERSWSLWYSGDSSKDDSCSFKEQGKYQKNSHLKIFFVENSGTSFIYGKNSCKITNHHLKPLGKTMSRHITLEPYLESLVLSRGYAGRTLTPFPSSA